MDIVVLCPTRGQPGAAAGMLSSFRETTHLLSTQIILVVDRDDARVEEYLALPAQFAAAASWSPLRPPNLPRVMLLTPEEGGCLANAFNSAAVRIWDDDCIIGMIGNDHRFNTAGWDRRVIEALARPGVAYGDDGCFGERLATAGFVSSVIPRTLGWLALPTSRHYGIDDAWTDLGRGIASLHYLPDVKITHESVKSKRARHRVDKDASYWEAQAHRQEDGDAYRSWRDDGGLAMAVAKLEEALVTKA